MDNNITVVDALANITVGQLSTALTAASVGMLTTVVVLGAFSIYLYYKHK